MLIRTGAERTNRIDLTLAAVLSCVAGALNAVGFTVAGSFTANMTGNLSMLAEEAARGRIGLALSFGGLVVAFVAGAAVAALAIQWGEARGIRAIYALAILGEAAVVLALALILLAFPGAARETQAVIVMSFALGLQNAVTTVISRAKVRTTHVSGMATDIGIGFAALLGGAEARREAGPKLRLHGLTLGCFCVGGVLGARGYMVWGDGLFLLAGGVLAAVALPDLWRAWR
ncbi:YoaK family protein [Sagittula salina]|uniref:DUF1275 domain-containing protein n=1 Tax=Sagittula salina TaxID=2820268 RepID=A0A940MU93_9RHOB|nr:YoaK family protein [Sagittula salina]MBP0483059.1 DUF1275 domain-containing protein [Sagittula salina]